MERGLFLISLDFELATGVFSNKSLEEYKENLFGARQVISQILLRFSSSSIHATWATVGILFAKSKEELVEYVPPKQKQPTYKEQKYNIYTYFDDFPDQETDSSIYFAPSILRKIQKTPGQEIASHTFSHFFCLEQGQTKDQFEADVAAAQSIAKSKGLQLTSIVFPRNQINEEYIGLLKQYGITCYRGTAKTWFNRPTSRKKQTFALRAMRLLDSYLPLLGSGCYVPNDNSVDTPMNLCASAFLRPYNPRLWMIEWLKLWRIKGQMIRAAKKREIFHLWWHPHNFGKNCEKNLAILDRIISYYQHLNEKYGFCSVTMAEAEELLRSNENSCAGKPM